MFDQIRQRNTEGRLLGLGTLMIAASLLATTAGAVNLNVPAGGTGTCCDSGWTFYTNSGITLSAGQVAVISASGVWDVCGGGCPTDADGDGYYNPNMTGCPGDCVAGSLMASVDGGATWILVGVGPTNVTGLGQLLLASNDHDVTLNTCTQNGSPGSCYWDNIGSLDVTVSIGQAPPTDAAQCRNGGWRSFNSFKNQGDCVSYVATGGRN